MPTYVYKREDGSTFEIEQRITEPALEVCPTTGQPVRRIPSAGAGLVFKGSGFYLTDYARKDGEGATGKASPDAAASEKSVSEKPTGTGTADDPGVSTTGGTGTAGASTPGSVGST